MVGRRPTLTPLGEIRAQVCPICWALVAEQHYTRHGAWHAALNSVRKGSEPPASTPRDVRYRRNDS